MVLLDTLGLFSQKLAYEVPFEVEAVPEEINIPDLVVLATGSTMHSGISESRLSGDSSTFLGIRPYLVGDNIRRIDWKRSHRFSELLVREYERLNATDGTILVDRRFVAQFEFGALNTLETVRDTALALAQNLLRQQIRVQVWGGGVHVPFGKGRAHADWIRDAVHEFDANTTEMFVETVSHVAAIVPPDSVFVPVFVRAVVDFAALGDVFLCSTRDDVSPGHTDVLSSRWREIGGDRTA